MVGRSDRNCCSNPCFLLDTAGQTRRQIFRLYRYPRSFSCLWIHTRSGCDNCSLEKSPLSDWASLIWSQQLQHFQTLSQMFKGKVGNWRFGILQTVKSFQTSHMWHFVFYCRIPALSRNNLSAIRIYAIPPAAKVSGSQRNSYVNH